MVSTRRDVGVPGSSVSPPAASITFSAHTRRDARERLVKPAGMCCAMTIGGASDGIRVSTDSMACGPPVEAPIAMTPLRRRADSKRTAGQRRQESPRRGTRETAGPCRESLAHGP